MYWIAQSSTWLGFLLFGSVVASAPTPQTTAVAVICAVLLLIGWALGKKVTQSRHQKEIADLERIAGKMAVADARTTRKSHEAELERVRAAHQEELTALKDAHEAELAALQEKLNAAVGQEALKWKVLELQEKVIQEANKKFTPSAPV